MKYIKLLILFISIQISAQQGGMWIPSLLEGLNEEEMNDLGSTLSTEDIYDINNSSLKDAIVHFDKKCTSELISDSGLLLSNHHCGFSEIQSHSSIENDYLKNGFWAMTMEDELTNPGMVATLIIRIEDVTDKILSGFDENASLKENQSKIDKNLAKAVKKAKKETWQDAMIKSIYKGNQYLLFITETYKDVRLVGAPPSSIGKYGSDTDNWMWPRHTGDFSLFRIYANKDNKPAEYSKDNVPYKPKHFLPVSVDGVEEGDFTLVLGFPGTTNEYLPSVAIDQLVNVINPAKIEVREEALKIADEYMRADEKIKIQYASKYASIANYWKKWIGENQGIAKSKAISKKQEQEKEFSIRVKDNTKYNTILSDFSKIYEEINDVALARAYWTEVVNKNIDLLKTTVLLYNFEKKIREDEKSLDKEREVLIKKYETIFKNYSVVVDKPVFEKLLQLYKEKIPRDYLSDNLKNTEIDLLSKDVFEHSKLISLEGAKNLLSGNAEEILKKINMDKGYILGKELSDTYYKKINPQYDALNSKINALQKTYMKALMETFPNDRFFPDANSTLRVTYGKVSGYKPRDAVYYEPVSYLSGAIEKYVPGDYEFDLPSKLLELYKNKDFGPYGEDGKMPVNFIGTNHTTGGNSGSPVIDAHGNLIGLNFDRVWEGTMSDYNYDPDICRNIMVDVRYILFIVDKFAGNTRLIEEMKLVHPKM